MRIAIVFLFILSSLGSVANACAADLEDIVDGIQQRYASVETVAGTFQQTYRAPGINQVESGIFRMKRPALMRWEYRQPEEKLFVADGREVYLYSPLDNQVIIQSFSPSDVRGTPLEFLVGGGNIKKSFSAAREPSPDFESGKNVVIRLTPRADKSEYDYLVLEVAVKTYDLRRIVIHEHGGNTSEFLLSDLAVNVKIANKEFQFKPPRGVEKVRLDSKE